MKLTLLLIYFLLISCGKIESGGSGDALGQARPVSMVQPLSNFDRNNLSFVCKAMAIKAGILPSLISATLNFTTTQIDCSGKNPLTESVDTIIQNNGSNFIFKRKSNNVDFLFPDVETPDAGILADVCNNLNNIQNPTVNGNVATYITTSGIASSNCAVNTSGEVCIQIDKGARVGENFIIHTQDWLRIRITSAINDKIGFYTFRKKVTRGVCGQAQSQSFQANLNN